MSPIQLNSALLKSPPANVRCPQYNRSELREGFLHIGVGGFHRSHQCLYLDQLVSEYQMKDWAVCGIGIMPQDAGMSKALHAQDCLYTLVERVGNESTAQVIGSLKSYIFGYEKPAEVFAKMAEAETRIVSLTATEGGYCYDQGTGELDLQHPGIQNDLQNPANPRTIFGYLAEGLERRRQAGIAPFTVLSCDNLQGNGHVTRRTLLAFCQERDSKLAKWIEHNVTFPNSMVDRITPATTDAERDLVRNVFGINDACPVVAEPFRQWVIEDHFCNSRPTLENVGVQFTEDVAPYEKMKIRLLNASHSAMGYLGYLCGYRYIYEIAQAREFIPYIKSLMDVEVTPLVPAVPGVNLTEYKQSLMQRFANEAIKDQALRICMDGSGKMPKFILPSIEEQLSMGGPIDRLTLCVASWIRFLYGKDENNEPIPIVDPQAERLTPIVGQHRQDPKPLLQLTDIFGQLGQSQRFVSRLEYLLNSLYSRGARATLELCMSEATAHSVT